MTEQNEIKKSQKNSIPSAVNIHGVEYEIISDPYRALDKHVEWEDTDSLGFFSETNYYIVINPNQPDRAKGSTLLHEIVHAFYWSAGGRESIGKKKEEAVVSLVASSLFDLIRNNPKLIEYIQEMDTTV